MQRYSIDFFTTSGPREHRRTKPSLVRSSPVVGCKLRGSITRRTLVCVLGLNLFLIVWGKRQLLATQSL